ncbi:MAG: site-2 protease family protein [Patescibacteria group bacterium]|jgi:Zn-dependent protease|nr:site-2 protease family protein [Patescibacteria group bacterium]
MNPIFLIIVLILSAVFHEYMHGYVAYRLGDPTAKNAGRLTFNPIKHLDPFGSVILPLIMVMFNSSFLFAWAKPVPYNPYNLRDRKYGDAKVAAAGPLANLALAIVFGLIIRLTPFSSVAFTSLLSLVVYINLFLMVFNLIPIPPLDGSKIVTVFLSPENKLKYLSLEKYGLLMVIPFVIFFGDWIVIPVHFLFGLIAGF